MRMTAPRTRIPEPLKSHPQPEFPVGEDDVGVNTSVWFASAPWTTTVPLEGETV